MGKDTMQLYSNLKALETWLSLFSGTKASTEDYIKSIPEARVFFSTTERYKQMVKLRCLIAENRLEEALDLSTFLTGYFVSYSRTFLWMENEVLKAIILYRMGDSYWKKILHDVLKKAYEYHFVRVISIEGAAVLPLLKQMKEEGGTLKEVFMKRMRNMLIT